MTTEGPWSPPIASIEILITRRWSVWVASFCRRLLWGRCSRSLVPARRGPAKVGAK
jgi:hypothetical protein